MRERTTENPPAAGGTGRAARRGTRRSVGVDAARGLALVAIMCVHILPMSYAATGKPTVTWILFPGDSPALFALLAGTGLAFTSGGRRPFRGREMTAARVGIVVRALLLLLLGLLIGLLMPPEPPAYNILIYFAAYFLLALPFLGLGSRALFAGAAVFLVAGPLLLHLLGDSLPGFSLYNPTFATLAAEPLAVLGQLLLTGTYPALPYLAYVLTGMAIGRLNLRRRDVQVRLLVVGAALAVTAKLVSRQLLYAGDVYTRLLFSDPDLTAAQLESLLVYGPTGTLPTTSPWWLVLTTPDVNTPFSVAWSLGVSLAVVGTCLLLARRHGAWLQPLAALGAMTLTLYTAHLVFLSFELFYTAPALWLIASLVLSVLFALAWQRAFGAGPVEQAMNAVVRPVRRAVAQTSSR
ncbi:heparan-alpha-glucosaminide N-acetyltransferase domain-containing protein [uncultured Kocuria sp.]|uniref:heparan-alpha-glucosaminide N-acetyltransferase domain-containing protein n=1 Tax=uncultured Kocuria sp. TaxID=259305 RepID=UPI0026387023|nr:heparan-alpha-glucosaminide N-acetyltransferase domain-containing protein [uncultured Kocuria sp.]